MNNSKTLLQVVAVSLLTGAAVLAAEPTAPARPQEQKGQRWLQRLDKDGDGQLSPEERNEARRRMQGSRGRNPALRSAEAVPSDAKVLRDIEYAEVGGQKLRLDLYLPADADAGDPLPLVVWVHGGGWQAGSKNNCPVAPLCGQGYAVASIQYRLTDVASFPAQIHDCKAAIRWLRANAKKHGINPDRVGAVGASAGGHLVALLGTSGGMKELEGDVGGNTDQSSAVQAVVDFCGPAAFVDWENAGGAGASERGGGKALAKLLGGPLSENQEKARLASPVVHASQDDPPFLIIHGDEDPLVPLSQSERLAAALKKAGAPVRLQVMKGAGHGLVDIETLELTRAFFDKHLKKQAASRAAE